MAPMQIILFFLFYVCDNKISIICEWGGNARIWYKQISQQTISRTDICYLRFLTSYYTINKKSKPLLSSRVPRSNLQSQAPQSLQIRITSRFELQYKHSRFLKFVQIRCVEQYKRLRDGKTLSVHYCQKVSCTVHKCTLF